MTIARSNIAHRIIFLILPIASIQQIIVLNSGIWIQNSINPNVLYFMAYPGALANYLRILYFSMFVAVGIYYALGKSTLKRRYLTYIIAFILVGAFYWSVQSIYESGLKTTILYSSSPVIFAMIFGIYLGSDKEVWDIIIKQSIWISVLFSFMSLYYLNSYSYNMIYRGGNSPVIAYMVQSFWLLSIYALSNKDSNRFKSIIVYSISAILLFISITAAMRSWIILVILLMIIYSLRSVRGSFIALRRLLITISLIAIMIIALSSYSEITRLLIMKMTSDNRSSQYVDLFSQVSITSLITGGGVQATYYSSQYGVYSSFDNQIVFLLFHYGMVIAFPYVTILVSSIYYSIKYLRLNHQKDVVVLILWLFAVLGVSIYNGIEIDIKNMIIMILIGRCLCTSDPNIHFKPLMRVRTPKSIASIGKPK